MRKIVMIAIWLFGCITTTTALASETPEYVDSLCRAYLESYWQAGLCKQAPEDREAQMETLSKIILLDPSNWQVYGWMQDELTEELYELPDGEFWAQEESYYEQIEEYYSRMIENMKGVTLESIPSETDDPIIQASMYDMYSYIIENDLRVYGTSKLGDKATAFEANLRMKDLLSDTQYEIYAVHNLLNLALGNDRLVWHIYCNDENHRKVCSPKECISLCHRFMDLVPEALNFEKPGTMTATLYQRTEEVLAMLFYDAYQRESINEMKLYLQQSEDLVEGCYSCSVLDMESLYIVKLYDAHMRMLFHSLKENSVRDYSEAKDDYTEAYKTLHSINIIFEHQYGPSLLEMTESVSRMGP